ASVTGSASAALGPAASSAATAAIAVTQIEARARKPLRWSCSRPVPVKSPWTRGRERSSMSLLAGGIRVRSLDQDRLVLDVVAHGHDSSPDLGDVGRARVLDEPDRAAHSRRAEVPARAEVARAVAPELARLGLLGGGRRLAGGRAAERLHERQVRDRLGSGRLRDLEDAVVEVRTPRVAL